MDFLIDAQLPPALARALTDRGFAARHLYDLRLLGAPDHAIWRRAMKERAAIVTKDEDFALLRRTAKTGPVIVWLRVGNTANTHLIPWLLALMPQVTAAIANGETLLELR
ncbi:MAG TPA: DUF5615 family PIN-like protein [Rhizomicrobium sp.]